MALAAFVDRTSGAQCAAYLVPGLAEVAAVASHSLCVQSFPLCIQRFADSEQEFSMSRNAERGYREQQGQ